MCLRVHERVVRARLGPLQNPSPVAFRRLVRATGALRQHLLRSRCALLLVVWFGAAIVLCAPTCSRADGEQRVLMLHSVGLRFKPWTDFAQIIRSEITRNARRP